MFCVEFPKEEAGIDFNGGFEYEYLPGGGVRVFPISPDGEPCRVSRKLYAQMCKFARNQLPGLQEQVGDMIATRKY